MADFVLLYSGGNMPETDDEKARVMKAWDGWYTRARRGHQGRGQPVRTGGQDHREPMAR